MRRRLLAASCLLAIRGLAQHPAATAARPDGHWWLAATPQLRAEFNVGWSDCQGWLLHRVLPVMARIAFERAVTAYYQAHPGALQLPVTTVIARLEAGWEESGQYRFAFARPQDEYVSANVYLDWMYSHRGMGYRTAIVAGFVACQEAQPGFRTSLSIETIKKRVAVWYHPDYKYTDMAHHEGSPIRVAILRAERK